MNKFNETYGLIMEEILPTPWKLLNDITEKIKKINKIIYLKNDLLKLCDKNWKFYYDLENSHKNFSITILKCSKEEIINLYDVEIENNFKMLYFQYEYKYNNFIWVDIKEEINEKFLNIFTSFLKHELGHVWENLKEISNPIGVVSFSNKYDRKNIFKNSLQLFTLKNIYKENEELLKRDFNYILSNNENGENYEFAPVIDQILELLVNDYLKYNENINPENYLENLFNSILNNDFKNLSIIKNFNSYSHLEKILFARLFLILSFGTSNQIKYFKDACKEEFGDLKK